MLVITVDRGNPALSQSPLPFSPNIVPAPESHRSVAMLVPTTGVVARPYPVRTIIQFSFKAVPSTIPLETFRKKRKNRFTQHLAERIEIPFRSKKLCKSALLQSRSLFVRRPVNRPKTGGRRRYLIAAEALAATQAHRSPWRKPRKSVLLGYSVVCSPAGSVGYYTKDAKNVKQKGACICFGSLFSDSGSQKQRVYRLFNSD